MLCRIQYILKQIAHQSYFVDFVGCLFKHGTIVSNFEVLKPQHIHHFTTTIFNCIELVITKRSHYLTNDLNVGAFINYTDHMTRRHS